MCLPANADLIKDVNQAILAGLPESDTRTNVEKLYGDRCASIEKTIGFADTPMGHATKYSCDIPCVGIALYAGSDLGKHPPEKVGSYFVDELRVEGLKAELFIKSDHDHGSSMAFLINGASYFDNAVRPSEAAKLLRAIIAESKLILYSDGRLEEIPVRKSND